MFIIVKDKQVNIIPYRPAGAYVGTIGSAVAALYNGDHVACVYFEDDKYALADENCWSSMLRPFAKDLLNKIEDWENEQA